MTESSASSHAELSSRRTVKEGRRPELRRRAGCECGQEASHTTACPRPRHSHPVLTQGLSSQSPAAGQHRRPGSPGCTGRHSSSRRGGDHQRTDSFHPTGAWQPQLFRTRILRTHSARSLSSTYRDSEGHRASKTPDECIIDGEPAEVGVPIALGVQAHSETWEHGDNSRGRGGQGLGKSGGQVGSQGQAQGMTASVHHLSLPSSHRGPRMSAWGTQPSGGGLRGQVKSEGHLWRT